MKVEFEHYNPNDTTKKIKIKSKPRIVKTLDMTRRIDNIENLLNKLDCLLNLKYLKDDTGEISSYKNSVKAYIDWSLIQLNNIDANSKNYNFTNKEQEIIFNFDIYLTTLNKLNKFNQENYLSSELILSSNYFHSSYIENSIQNYINDIDPFGLWFNSDQIFKIFHSANFKYLKITLILLFIRFKKPRMDKEELYEVVKGYYQSIKMWIHEAFKNPSLESLLTLIMLSFYEFTTSNIQLFKKRIHLAKRMAHILGFHKINFKERNKTNSKKRINLLKRGQHIWESLTLTAFTLAITLDEPMDDFFTYDPEYRRIQQECIDSRYMILLEPADKFCDLKILKDARENLDLLVTILPHFLWFMFDARSKVLGLSKEELNTYMSKLKRESSPILDKHSRDLMIHFTPNIPLNELYIKIKKLVIWLKYHYTIENWITYGPVLAVSFYSTMIAFPEFIDVSPISLISFIQIAPIANSWYNQRFLSWKPLN